MSVTYNPAARGKRDYIVTIFVRFCSGDAVVAAVMMDPRTWTCYIRIRLTCFTLCRTGDDETTNRVGDIDIRRRFFSPLFAGFFYSFRFPNT
jgi:hypothetical protein